MTKFSNKGFSLIEMLIYLSIATLLLAVAGSTLRSLLDYQEAIVRQGDLYENSARFFANFSLDARNCSGFTVLDGGHRIRLNGDTPIYYFREGDRLKKQVGKETPYFITDTTTKVSSVNFAVYAGVVKVEVDFNKGEYKPVGYYWARN